MVVAISNNNKKIRSRPSVCRSKAGQRRRVTLYSIEPSGGEGANVLCCPLAEVGMLVRGLLAIVIDSVGLLHENIHGCGEGNIFLSYFSVANSCFCCRCHC